MNPGFRSASVMFLSLAACSIAAAQAAPAAIQRISIYGFGAATGTYTGLGTGTCSTGPIPVTVVARDADSTCSSSTFGGGKNLGITAGVDVGFRPFHQFYPYVELRGTYPIDDGQVDAQKTILYGVKAARFYGRFHPYVDVLFGRDKIDYQNGGYPNADGTLLFIDSVSNVISFGGGLDLAVTDQIALKIDGQFQRIGVPINASGDIYAKPLSIGIAYRFDFNHHIRYDRDGNVKGYKPPPPPKPDVVPPPAPDAIQAPADNAPSPDPATPSPNTTTPPPAGDTSAPPSKPSPDTPNPQTLQQPQ